MFLVYCSRWVLVQRPKPEEYPRIVLVYRANIDLPTIGAQVGNRKFKECPQVRINKCLHGDWFYVYDDVVRMNPYIVIG